jgi:hypothetical protein
MSDLFIALLFGAVGTLTLVCRDRVVASNLKRIVAGRCCDDSRSSVAGVGESERHHVRASAGTARCQARRSLLFSSDLFQLGHLCDPAPSRPADNDPKNVDMPEVDILAFGKNRGMHRSRGGCEWIGDSMRIVPGFGGAGRAPLGASGCDSSSRGAGLGRELARLSRNVRLRFRVGVCASAGNRRAQREVPEDPILRPLFEDWRSGDDSAYRRFMDTVLAWTEDEDEPN